MYPADVYPLKSKLQTPTTNPSAALMDPLNKLRMIWDLPTIHGLIFF